MDLINGIFQPKRSANPLILFVIHNLVRLPNPHFRAVGGWGGGRNSKQKCTDGREDIYVVKADFRDQPAGYLHVPRDA